MVVTFQFDQSRFQEQALRFIDELGLAAKDVVKDQTRLLLQGVIAHTPPKSQAKGRAAVARDIARAMQPIAVDKFLPATRRRIEDLIERGQNNSLEVLLRASGRKGARVLPFSPDLHRSLQAQLVSDRKLKAKVFIPGTIGAVSTSLNTGKEKSGGIGDTPRYQKYVASVQKNVGRLKAAWGVAYTAVGGSLPAWVKRHSNPSGAVNVNFSDPQRPYVEFRNFAKGVGFLRQIFQTALHYRAEAMRRDIAGRLKRASRKAGFH